MIDDTFYIYTDGSVNNLKIPYEIDLEKEYTVGTWSYITMTSSEMIVDTASGNSLDMTIANSELKAIDMALRGIRLYLKDKKIPLHTVSIEIYSDSKFSVQAFNKFIKVWRKNANAEGQWIKSNNEPVVNQHEFERILHLMKDFRSITICHISAHKGFTYNEMVDKLCTFNFKKFKEISLNRYANTNT